MAERVHLLSLEVVSVAFLGGEEGVEEGFRLVVVRMRVVFAIL